MPWYARLQLDYLLESHRSVARFRHDGPLRILRSLYPEGDAICHNVLVHPPGGLVGGDMLDFGVTVGPGAHGLITTPGATRFYRTLGEAAAQHTRLKLAAGARLEWLPLETICYDGCLAENRLSFELAPEAEIIGWDITALGLPHAERPFARGSFCQHIELPGVWLEHGCINALDSRLLEGPLGLAGQRCFASVFFVTGSPLGRERRQQALDSARAALITHKPQITGGATNPNSQVVIVRALAPLVEPAMSLLRQVWANWRAHLWGITAQTPRIWSM